ncbi:MAG: transposase [Bryobacteraceae bacterium]|jgi:putative DNA methylase
MDRLLEEVRTGPFHLRQPAVAGAVAEAIHYRVDQLGHYELHAFVVMPNHVHILMRPLVPLAILTKSLKSFTARRANAILGRTGVPFWQAESYDHQIRDGRELAEIRHYIEENPVRAGLVKAASRYRWSSAWEATQATTAR